MKSACLSSNRLETSPWSRSLQTRLLCHILRLHLHQSKVIVKSLKIMNWPLALISIIAFFCPEGRFICLWRTFPYCTRQIVALVTRKNICCDPHPVSWTFFPLWHILWHYWALCYLPFHKWKQVYHCSMATFFLLHLCAFLKT